MIFLIIPTLILDVQTPAKDTKPDLVREDDMVPCTPQSPGESTPRRLQKQIDKAIGDHRTSASMINAVMGPDGISTRGNIKKQHYTTVYSLSFRPLYRKI